MLKLIQVLQQILHHAKDWRKWINFIILDVVCDAVKAYCFILKGLFYSASPHGSLSVFLCVSLSIIELIHERSIFVYDGSLI